MNKAKTIYAAYGSNMNIDQMIRRCPEAKLICPGILKDFSLEFRGNGVATVIPEVGQMVPIVLWSITKECEDSLDIYEGYPRLYIKKEITVETRDINVTAMVYVMNGPYLKQTSRPSENYYNIIKEGYRDNNIESGPLIQALDRSMIKQIHATRHK